MRYNVNSKQVEVYFNHNYCQDDKSGQCYPISTDCEILFEQSYIIDTAVCHPKDQFIKRLGRLCAFKRCLNFIRDDGLLSKPERAELFKQVFPNLTSSSKKRGICVLHS